MSIAKKFHVEGPIGEQLNKKEYSKMVERVDAAMQKILRKKKSRIPKRSKEKA